MKPMTDAKFLREQADRLRREQEESEARLVRAVTTCEYCDRDGQPECRVLSPLAFGVRYYCTRPAGHELDPETEDHVACAMFHRLRTWPRTDNEERLEEPA